MHPAATAFISVSYAHHAAMRPALDAIRAACADAGLHAHIFVDAYDFAPDDARAMMDQAQADIRAAHLLIAELTHKAIGVGIEIGFAAALHKPVIVLRHESAERSTTAEGIADHALVYADPDDLRATLARLLIAITRDTLPGPL